MFPESSMAMIQRLFPFLNMSGNFNLANEFYLTAQVYEKNLFRSNFDDSKLKLLLKGDLCQDSYYKNIIPSTLQSYCLANPSRDNSLSTNFNLLHSYLLGNVNENSVRWLEIGKNRFIFSEN